MSKFMIGWSEIDITPAKSVSLVGQFAERISEYVEKPLTATAMAISKDGEQLILASCDLVGISWGLRDAIREKLAGNTVGVDPMKVVINATHTHTGPGYTNRGNSLGKLSGSGAFRGLLESQLPPDKHYVESANVSENPNIASNAELLEFLSDRIAKVIIDAWKNLAPGSFSNAFGRAPIGMCRRACYTDGSAQMWGDTDTAVFTQLEGGNDSGIELMYVFDEDKKLKGIVANLACPAQCVQHRLFVSPDFWGEAKKLIREHFGDIYLLPQCSAAGDQCPVDLVRWVEPESDVHDPNLKRNNPPKRKADPSMFDIAGMKVAGRRIAREIIDVYEQGIDEAQTDPEFVHEVHMMQIPLRRATLAQIKEAKREIAFYLNNKPGDTVDFNDAANLQIYLGILRRAEHQEIMECMDIESHIVKLGTIAIATNPYELFLDYGNQIKARSHAEQTFLIQLANGTEGYLPTEKAENGGHYSAFISSGTTGHIGGDLLVRNTLKAINRLFPD